MKRIDYIVKNGSKCVIKDGYSFRERKVTRTLDTSIDYVDEQAQDYERKAIEALNSIKDVSDNSESIADKFNKYIEYMDAVEGYKRSKEYLLKAKELLQEEVEVEEEDK